MPSASAHFSLQVSVNGLDKAGSTPLHWAAHGGHVTCVEALLSAPKCEITVQVCPFFDDRTFFDQ